MNDLRCYDLIIKRAKNLDGSLADIAIRDGKVAALGLLPEDATARQTLDLHGGVYVSAGWIDSHVHCYPKSPVYHDEPDLVGVAGGVTSVVDAGSTGADDVEDFHRLACQAETHVYALLNIARTGIATQSELADMARIDQNAVHTAIKQYPGFIIGIKAFTAAVLGGIGSLPGAMLGGLILGVAEAQFSGMVNTDYKDVFSFSLLIVILIFRPQGLLGRPLVVKV